MALLSKFLADFGHATGIPALAISRTLYSAAILAYVYNVVVPQCRKKSKQGTKNEDTEEDEQVQKRIRQMSSCNPAIDHEKPKGPAVNK